MDKSNNQGLTHDYWAILCSVRYVTFSLWKMILGIMQNATPRSHKVWLNCCVPIEYMIVRHPGPFFFALGVG